MEKNKIIDLTKRVTVIGTGKSSFMPKGKEFQVHPKNADYLVKAGKASFAKEKE